MKKILIGIFAHPDDEAFGPAGTLLKLKDEGRDLHLILLTDGDVGVNIDNVPDLAATRLTEWETSAELLGATSAYALHYPDGALEAVNADELDEKVNQIITETTQDYSEPVEISFMTFEPNGLTGHHDHIVASELATRMASQFKTHELWYFCLDGSQAPLENTTYYEPRAREDSYITTRIDISDWLAKKHHIMDAHVSQRSDADVMKAVGSTTECFHVERF